VPRRPAFETALAVASVAAAFVLQLGIRSLIGDRQPFVTFYLAVMISAWWGGLRPALLAVALGFVSGVYFVTFADGFSFRLSADEAILTTAYSVFAPLIAWFVHGMREAQQRALSAMRAAEASAAAAQESEQKIRRLVDSNIIGSCSGTKTGRSPTRTRRFSNMSGYTPEALSRGWLRWTDIVAPENLARHRAALEEMRGRGECEPFDSAILRADGLRVPIVCGGVSFDPEVTRGVTFVVDTTESWHVRRELEAEEARYRALFEDTPVVLIEEDWSALKRRVDACAPRTATFASISRPIPRKCGSASV
jgi:PAS domain-containing protein